MSPFYSEASLIITQKYEFLYKELLGMYVLLDSSIKQIFPNVKMQICSISHYDKQNVFKMQFSYDTLSEHICYEDAFFRNIMGFIFATYSIKLNPKKF